MSEITSVIWSKIPPGIFLRGKRTGANDPRRIFVRKKIASEAPSKLLDIPCGPGIDLEGLRLDGVEVSQYIGCDITMSFLRYCKRNFPSAEFVRCSVEFLPFQDDSIDVGSCKDLLEHLPTGAEPALKELLRVCRQKVLISWFIPPTRNRTQLAVKYPYSNLIHRLYVFAFTKAIGKIQYNFYNSTEVQEVIRGADAAVIQKTTIGHNFNHEPCEVWEISPANAKVL